VSSLLEPNSSSDATDEPSVDESRRQFLLTTTCVLGTIGAVCAITPFASSWLPSAKAREEGGAIRVDVSSLAPGEQMTVVWRGKPVWIFHRTPDMLQQLIKHSDELRDPDSRVEQQPIYAQNAYRAVKPQYLVLIGVCTHLGCIPKYKPCLQALGTQWQGGFYCPCHGSMFDLSGRVYKNAPAPINLQVPPYHFVSEHVIVIGEDPNA
jgi:ubiquinol-cytochrome c reductase iron-sulfur subunit